jgi:hypothetical protein
MTKAKSAAAKGSFSSGGGPTQAQARPLLGAIVFLHVRTHIAETLEEQAARGALSRGKHPFAAALAEGVHLSTTAAPSRVDEVNQAERVILAVPTADVPALAEHIIVPTFHQRFDNQFPPGFNLTDPFPDDLYKVNADNARCYVGPSFDDLLEPATWVTSKIPVKDSKAVYKLRSAFLGQWLWVRNLSAFVNHQQPNLLLKPEALDYDLASLSHQGSKPAERLLAKHEVRVDRLAYRPGRPTGLLNIGGETCFNTWRPTRIVPVAGGIKPFEDLLDHLFPFEGDRYQVLRWLMTLVAKPERHITYGLLLVSETQGTGRNTLADQVMAPLIGRHNCSWPNQSAVMADFNEWRINKRLAIISEIHAGHGWKMYKMLQDVITDEYFMAHRKNFSRFELESFVHVMGISNNLRALVIDKGDRRWLIPKMAGIKLALDNATQLRAWLIQGGLSHIYAYALNFNNYIAEGEEAPATFTKDAMIEDTTSEHMHEAQHIAFLLSQYKTNGVAEPAAITWGTVRTHLKMQHGDFREPEVDIRRAMGQRA